MGLGPVGEHMAIKTDDATHDGERQPVIRIRATVEISGEWVSNEMIAYAAEQFANSLAGHLRAAAAEKMTEEAPGGGEAGGS
jgi:hypothetical protein